MACCQIAARRSPKMRDESWTKYLACMYVSVIIQQYQFLLSFYIKLRSLMENEKLEIQVIAKIITHSLWILENYERVTL